MSGHNVPEINVLQRNTVSFFERTRVFDDPFKGLRVTSLNKVCVFFLFFVLIDRARKIRGLW